MCGTTCERATAGSLLFVLASACSVVNMEQLREVECSRFLVQSGYLVSVVFVVVGSRVQSPPDRLVDRPSWSLDSRLAGSRGRFYLLRRVLVVVFSFALRVRWRLASTPLRFGLISLPGDLLLHLLCHLLN